MVVDSSIWIEILSEGPLHKKCSAALQRQTIRIPTLVLHEVYKKIRSKASEDLALTTMASLSENEVLDLDREIAIRAADLSIQFGIGTADSIVLAHAEQLNDTLLTLDNDFAGLPGAKVIR